MTLRIYTDVEQRSDEWYDLRRGLLTASTIGQLITPKTIKPAANPISRNLTALLAAERITGWTEPTYRSDDMLMGAELEPEIRDLYTEHYQPVTECGFMIEDRWGYQLGYSPDGLIGDETTDGGGLIEIKVRRAKQQLTTILDNAVPAEDMAQLQCGLLVSGRDWLDYISYCGGMPLFVKRVHPQQDWFDAILEAAQACEDAICDILERYRWLSAGLHPTERHIEQEIIV